MLYLFAFNSWILRVMQVTFLRILPTIVIFLGFLYTETLSLIIALDLL